MDGRWVPAAGAPALRLHGLAFRPDVAAVAGCAPRPAWRWRCSRRTGSGPSAGATAERCCGTCATCTGTTRGCANPRLRAACDEALNWVGAAPLYPLLFGAAQRPAAAGLGPPPPEAALRAAEAAWVGGGRRRGGGAAAAVGAPSRATAGPGPTSPTLARDGEPFALSEKPALR